MIEQNEDGLRPATIRRPIKMVNSVKVQLLVYSSLVYRHS